MKDLFNQIVLDIQFKLANFLTLRPLVSKARKQIPSSDINNLRNNTSLLTSLEQLEKNLFSVLPKALEIQKGKLEHAPKLLFEIIDLNKQINTLTNNAISHLKNIKKMYGGNFEIPKASVLDYLQFIPLLFFTIPLILVLSSSKKEK